MKNENEFDKRKSISIDRNNGKTEKGFNTNKLKKAGTSSKIDKNTKKGKKLEIEDKENLDPKTTQQTMPSRINKENDKTITKSCLENLSNKLQCKICDKSFERNFELLQHIKKIHENTSTKISGKQKKINETKSNTSQGMKF